MYIREHARISAFFHNHSQELSHVSFNLYLFYLQLQTFRAKRNMQISLIYIILFNIRCGLFYTPFVLIFDKIITVIKIYKFICLAIIFQRARQFISAIFIQNKFKYENFFITIVIRTYKY